MGAYLGDEKFASGGGTINVTAHQFTNSTTDIKANSSSASLGVLDTIVRADHIHPFSDAETFAESERVKSNNASYGAIVHQKDIEPVVVYDKDSADASINQGKTSGFPAGTVAGADYDNWLNLYPASERNEYVGINIYMVIDGDTQCVFMPESDVEPSVYSAFVLPNSRTSSQQDNKSTRHTLTANFVLVGTTGTRQFYFPHLNDVYAVDGTVDNTTYLNSQYYSVIKVEGVKKL